MTCTTQLALLFITEWQLCSKKWVLFLVKVHFISLLLLGAFFKFVTFGCIFWNSHYFNQQKSHDLQNCYFYLDTLTNHSHNHNYLPQPQHTQLTPRGSCCTTHPPAPCCGLASCSPRPRPQQWACGGGLATTALITPMRHWCLPSQASYRCRSWSVTPGVRPAVTLVYSSQNNGGSGHATKPMPLPPPPPPTPLTETAPLANSPHGGPPGPGQRGKRAPGQGRWCPWTGKTLPRTRRHWSLAI